MNESLYAIRRLGLARVFEDLYFGSDVPAGLQIYMRYPREFHSGSLVDWQPLTLGGLIPILADGNFQEVCLFDSRAGRFVVKSIEEPAVAACEFVSWQQFLAHRLVEIADSGLDGAGFAALANAVGFARTNELIALLDMLDGLGDVDAAERAAQFIRDTI